MPSLDALVESDMEVDAVVTNPDKPAGRGLDVQPGPVKTCALRHGLDVVQPTRARDRDFIDWFRSKTPDVATVVAYGKILPGELLDIPRLGFVNVHFSLLPAYRGAAPVQRAVMNGDEETGISMMVLTEGMDEGPVLTRMSMPIEHSDTAGTVGARLADLGADLLVDVLHRYDAGELTAEPQDDSAATYAPKIGNEDAFVDWSRSSRQIRDHVRGLDPSPGAATTFGGKLIKIWGLEPASSAPRLEPGEVAVIQGDIVVGTGDDAVTVRELQPAGKRRMTGPEYARGLRLGGKERFGGPV